MRRCSTGAPSVTWISRKWTVLDSVAEYSLIGTLTMPKVTVPFQIERGIAFSVPASAGVQARARPRQPGLCSARGEDSGNPADRRPVALGRVAGRRGAAHERNDRGGRPAVGAVRRL